VPFDAMPHVINPPSGVIVTANNRVAPDDGPDYLCTDCHPPYRAQRMLARLESLERVSPSDAEAIHADVLSPHGALLRDWLARIPPPDDSAAAALRDELLAWDGQMRADATAPAAYMALRRAITMRVAQRSGLAGVGTHAWGAVPPGVLPINQLWWAVPNLMRRNDTRLLDGWRWEQVLTEALREAAGSPRPWGEVHRPRFVHPLAGTFPWAAALLNPPSLPIGGDTDTVQANGISAAAGLEATYGAIARYVYDVGNWDACRWAVFHGTSGHPGSPHYADQNPVWSRCEMVPMLYSWSRIEVEADVVQQLRP
jgi:penicillin amidase